MYKQLCCLLLAVLASASRGDDGAPAPSAKPVPQGTPGLLVQDDESPPAQPLVDLRHSLQKLKSERDGLAEDREKAAASLQDSNQLDGADRAKLQLRLSNLLTMMATQKKAPPALLPSPMKTDTTFPSPLEKTPAGAGHSTPKKKTTEPSPDVANALDPLALATNLFLAGNYHGALQAYRLLPQEGLKAEERVPLQFMIANCLRKLGKGDEAAALYREIANSRGDEHLAECAQWQLGLTRWRRDTAGQLERIRQRRLELEKQP